METWFVIVVTLCVSSLVKSLFDLIFSTGSKLPPGPLTVPIIGNFLLLKRSLSEIEPILRNLFLKYGPVVTLQIGPYPAVLIRDRAIAHRGLVQNGAVFSDRPPSLPTRRVINSDQRNISSAPYGPNWRALRRNLTSEILHPSRVGSYSRARRWVLRVLLGRLGSRAESGEAVRVVEHFRYSMFCLLVLMCFGERLDETQIGEIESIQRRLLLDMSRFNFLNLMPRVSKILFRRRWSELLQIRRDQEKVYFPLIEARRALKLNKTRAGGDGGDGDYVVAYVDTLLDSELPEDKRAITDGEIVSNCSEFLTAGTDTTFTSLQWIMANLVKNPEIQEKLFLGIKSAMEDSNSDEVREEDLEKMPYLKAVVLEGLRRHAAVEGYLVPRRGSVNFTVAEMGWDGDVWEEPMEFRPERFMSVDGRRVEVFDMTGSREIRMMPFGAGRRMCPAYDLAIMHLEYFVGNMVWRYEWSAVAGEEVDLSEKQEFTMVMKHPLNACITERTSS